ncbi:cation:dicarboxylate symporter family transporter, partial [Megamonas funiformis]|uniref:cation:dicarboxylate symporter family transporter n=1 Tax=Megamonas funiformis TaxID=437897 RepID=UPI00265CC4B4
SIVCIQESPAFRHGEYVKTMGLPIEIMGMIVGIFRLIDMIHTALNVTGDVVSTLAVARIEHMYKE